MVSISCEHPYVGQRNAKTWKTVWKTVEWICYCTLGTVALFLVSEVIRDYAKQKTSTSSELQPITEDPHIGICFNNPATSDPAHAWKMYDLLTDLNITYFHTSGDEAIPIILQEGNNIIPGSNGDSIFVKRSARCYSLTSKNKNLHSLEGAIRLIVLQFSKKIKAVDPALAHLQGKALPNWVYFVITSNANSYGIESGQFYEGKPEMVVMPINHFVSVDLETESYQNLPDIGEGCESRNFWEVIEEAFVAAIEDTCPQPCSPTIMPNNKLDLCTLETTSNGNTGFNYDCAQSVLSQVSDDLSNFKPPCNKLQYKDTSQGLISLIYGFIFAYRKYNPYDGAEMDLESQSNHKEYMSHEDENIRLYQILLDFSDEQPTIYFEYKFPKFIMSYQQYVTITFGDLIGNVGGMLSLFIGFSFIDNILSMVGYLTVFWQKINNRKKISVVKDNPEPSKNGTLPNQKGKNADEPKKTSVPIKKAELTTVNEVKCEDPSSGNPEIKESCADGSDNKAKAQVETSNQTEKEKGVPNPNSDIVEEIEEASIANELDGNEPKSVKIETSAVENMKKEGRLSAKKEEMIVNAEVHTESETIPT